MVHFFGWIPVWGAVINCVLWLLFKSRSREMVFHIQQAIQCQIFVLLPMLAWILFWMIASIVGNLDAGVGNAFHAVNNFMLFAILSVFALVSMFGAGMVYIGRPFLYPLFGRRVLDGSLRKLQEG